MSGSQYIPPDDMAMYEILCCSLRVNTSLTPTRFAVLVSPNLTQLVIDLFTTFTTFTALPFLAAAIATHPMYLIMFRGRGYILGSIEVQGEESVVDRFDYNTWGVGQYERAERSCLAYHRADGCDHVYPTRDVIYDWYSSRPASV